MMTLRLKFGMWDFLGCVIIRDGMDTILRLEDTFFSLEREAIKKEKKKKTTNLVLEEL